MLYRGLPNFALGLCCTLLTSFGQSANNPGPLTPNNSRQLQATLSLSSPINKVDPSAEHITLPSRVDTSSTPALARPAPLPPIVITNPDPLPALDLLLAKQQVTIGPYVPCIQGFFVGLDYGRLVINTWQALSNFNNQLSNHEHDYVGSMGILFRKNIQLSGNLGHAQFHPPYTCVNKSKYTVKGSYGRIGLDYLIKYSASDNLYAGLRYGRSHFTNSTKPERVGEKIISQDLTASWVELVIGAETQLLQKYGLCAGLCLHLGKLFDFQEFSPANNYVIPGYGITANKFVSVPSLYIHYQVSFLKRLITFT